MLLMLSKNDRNVYGYEISRFPLATAFEKYCLCTRFLLAVGKLNKYLPELLEVMHFLSRSIVSQLIPI
jgi:hypothetical protein